jgi:hypothetical protein
MINKLNMRKIVNKKLTEILSELNINKNPVNFSELTENYLLSSLRKNCPIFFPDESFNLKTRTNLEIIGTIDISYKFSCAKVKVKLNSSNTSLEYDLYDNYELKLAFPYSLLPND